MRAVGAFTWSVVQDALHRKVFYAILAFAVVLMLLTPFLPSADVGVQIDLMREAALGLTSIMAFLLAIIMGTTIIQGELGRRTLYNTLSKPVRRWQYYLGKYIGIVIVVAIALAVSFVVLILFILTKFGVFNPGLAKALLAILFESMVLISIAMLVSVYLSPVIGILLTGLFYVLCHVKGDFLYRGMTEAGQNPVVKAVSGFFYYLLPNLERFNINETIAHGEKVFEVGALELFLLFSIAVAFTAAFIILGSYLFSRRDL
ncbi:MAG: ABC transporter permease subunit [Actinobacteria bacterium]|nr:ABC transporter permease subunit [Actinomycetota bacterium]